MTPPSKDKQDKIVKQFREQLVNQDLIHEEDTIGADDATLLRFLRARQFDLKAALTMWFNCQQWRETVEGVGIDELYRQLDPYDYPQRDKVFECWPLWFHKTDKKGRPLNIHHFGGIDMPELYKYISPQKFWQTIVVNAESLTREVLPASTRAAGRRIDGTFVIVDLKGFGLSQFWQMKSLARDSFQISQDYFPETMAQLAIINAPASFTTIWSFIKPWLAKETLAKVDVLGSDYADVLLRQIPAENLPTSLGGKCTCAEAGGCKLSNAGPWMERREERREEWLRGERKRIGFSLEEDDEDDGDVKERGEEEREAQVQEADALDAQPQQEESRQPDGVPPAPIPDTGAAYGKTTEVVDESSGAEKTSDSPESSPESTLGPSTPSTPSDASNDDSRSFHSATSSFASAHTGTDGSTGTGDDTVRTERKKFKLPKMLLGKKKSRGQSVSGACENHPEMQEPQMGQQKVSTEAS